MADNIFNITSNNLGANNAVVVHFDKENFYEKNSLGEFVLVGYMKEPTDILLEAIAAERDNYKNMLIEHGIIEKELTEAEKQELQNEKIDKLTDTVSSLVNDNKELKEYINLLLEDKKSKEL